MLFNLPLLFIIEMKKENLISTNKLKDMLSIYLSIYLSISVVLMRIRVI